MHIGDLKTDSPSLHSKLKSFLSAEELERLFLTYAEVWSKGGCEELIAPREPGVNFNPRPARILEILIGDCAAKDFETLQRAMFSCTVTDGNFAPFMSDLPRVAAQHILLAHVLDELRHAHMSGAASEDLDALMEYARVAVADSKLPEQDRLCILVRAAVDRLGRHIERLAAFTNTETV